MESGHHNGTLFLHFLELRDDDDAAGASKIARAIVSII